MEKLGSKTPTLNLHNQSPARDDTHLLETRATLISGEDASGKRGDELGTGNTHAVQMGKHIGQGRVDGECVGDWGTIRQAKLAQETRDECVCTYLQPGLGVSLCGYGGSTAAGTGTGARSNGCLHRLASSSRFTLCQPSGPVCLVLGDLGLDLGTGDLVLGLLCIYFFRMQVTG